METKIIVSDPKTGESFNKILNSEEMENLIGKKLGENITLSFMDLDGYEAQITGGSYMTGMPMRSDVDGIGLKKILIGKGLGNNTNTRLKKSVAGNTISQFTSQVNLKITKQGEKPLKEVLGKKSDG